MVYNDTYKFVAVVNKDLEVGNALNAIAHTCAGLVDMAPSELREKMSFIDFEDGDGFIHKNISGLSLIVLRGKNGEIKKLKHNLEEQQILFTDFIETMTGDTYKEQLDKTKATKEEDMKYYCLVAFGEKEKIDPLTKKFSLWH